MTACVNKKHTRRVSAVVTASLVGALSIGAPAVALAADGGIDTQALTPAEAFAQGTLTAQDGNGNEVTFPEKDDPTFTTASQGYLLPTSITVAGDKIDLNLKPASGNALVQYYTGEISDNNGVASVAEVGKGADTSKLAKNHEWTAGTYTAVITFKKDGSQYNNCQRYVTFKVKDVDLVDATIFNATNGNEDTSVTGFTYNGSHQKIGFAVDGVVLDSAKDYDVKVYEGDTVVSDEVVNAGTYTVYLYNKGDLSAGKPAVKNFVVTVNKLDLSTANVAASDMLLSSKGGSRNDFSFYANGIDLTNEVWFTLSTDLANVGTYSAKVTAKPSDNITGTTYVDFNVVTRLAKGGYFYDGTAFQDINAAGGLTVDLSKNEAWDEALITNSQIDRKNVDVFYFDASGKQVDASALSRKGTYTVVAKGNAQRSDYYESAVPKSITVTVKAPEVKTDEVVFKYKGEVCGDTLNGTYNGGDFLKDIAVSVSYKGKQLAEGTDYTVVVLDESGKKAESITDAGEYTVEVKSDAYEIDGGVLNVSIDKLTIDHVFVKSPLMLTFGDQTVIPYTGSEIDPSFEYGYYTDAKGTIMSTATDLEGNAYTWNALPAETVDFDAYKYSKNKNGSTWVLADALKSVGFYQVHFTGTDASVNYDVTDTMANNLVEVSDQKVFLDVPSTHWASQDIYKAVVLQYMGGYKGTQFFGPEDTLTRAQAAEILFNMAGGKAFSEDGNNGQYMDKYKAAADEAYTDVDASYWGAGSIGWATMTGVVKGNPDGTFDPEAEITREQFAIMLANYARMTGEYTEVDADEVLSGVAGGDEVDPWAKQEVAWAVSEGIMGQGDNLWAGSSIERAQVAIMAVRFQPEQVNDGDLFPRA